MDKTNFNFFNFVYKIIRFILLLPINIIKYFCIGFYYSCFVFINIVLYIVIFTSFGLYKIVKYLCLFFSFPMMIYNILHRNKVSKLSETLEQPMETELEYSISNDDLNIVSDNSNIEVSDSIINIDEILEQEELNDEMIDDLDENFVNLDTAEDDNKYELIDDTSIIESTDTIEYNAEVNESEEINNINESIIDSPKKIKTPHPNYLAIGFKTIFHGMYVGLLGICFPIYKLFKYLVLGILWILIITGDCIFKISFGVYKLFKYFVLGIYWILLIVWALIVRISFGVYKTFKYFVFGILWIILIFGNIFAHISLGVYKVFKYLAFSLTLPFVLINMIKRYRDDNSQLREELRLKRQEAKFKKQLMYQKKQEEKLRLSIEKKQKRQKQNEEYVNDSIKIEKKTFGQQFNELLNKIFESPSVLVSKIKSAYQNSVFVKNSQNKRDISRQALLIDFEGEDAEKSDVKLVYEYTAKNPEGKIVTDYFEAFSKVEVHSFLLSEGYEVYNIRTNELIQFFHRGASTSRAKLKNKDLIFFLNQLSTYIKAGIPLVESLKILTRQYKKQKGYQKLFRTIIYDLSMGDSFSTALNKQGNAFPRILINMIKASEMTGELPEVLDDMAEYFTEIDKTKKQMITALMYPMIILVISVVVVVFILLFVIPRFVTIYESMDASQIPQFTLMVLAVSNFLKKNFLYLIVGVLIIVLVIMYLYKYVKAFRTVAQWLLMHTPVFGNVIIYNEVTTFTKTFSSLLAHNVFITDSMEILNKVTNNEIYKMLILDTITNLAKGEKISESFKDHWAFPVPAYEMLVTGERTGQLPEMMAKVSSYYQELHRNAVTRIKTFIEPILIVFLTVIVGVIVLAIVVPMFGMYESVQNYG